MAKLIVGFDSAWTPTGSGSTYVEGCSWNDGTFRELAPPQTVTTVRLQRSFRGGNRSSAHRYARITWTAPRS